MFFDSFSALATMDGHGPYVWFSYGVSLLVLVALVLGAGQRRRAVEQRIQAMVRRERASHRPSSTNSQLTTSQAAHNQVNQGRAD